MIEKKSGRVIIRKATDKEVSQLLALQQSLLLGNRSGKEIEESGFLVYPVTAKEFSEILQNESTILFVAEMQDRVAGYILGYDLKEWCKNKPDWENSIQVTSAIKKHLLHDRTLYLRHVARKPDCQGLGSKLELQISDWARQQGYVSMIGEILEGPIINKISRAVHEKRGFKRIGQVDYKDGKVWGIYEKEIPSKAAKNLHSPSQII